jgi:signal transduction histidine kinase
MNRFLLFASALFFVLTNIYGQDPILINSSEQEVTIYDHLSVYYHPEWEKVPLDKIIQAYHQGKFYKPKNQKVYIHPNGKNVILHVDIKNESDHHQALYLTLGNSYLNYGKVYVNYGDSSESLPEISFYEKFPFKSVYYRHPTWKINVDKRQKASVFLEILDNETRTRLELSLETEPRFFKKTELEYLGSGFFFGFLIILIFALSIFGFIQKEYSIFFYCLYIIFIILEYLASKGLGIQFIWWNQPFITKNVRSMGQCLAFISAAAFYVNFYRYNKKTKWIRLIFNVSMVIVASVLLLYLAKYIFGGLITLYIYVWVLLQVLVTVFVILHIILAYKKVVPYYLSIAFSLPVIGILLQLFNNPSVKSSNLYIWIISNGFYIGITIEILLVSYFILSSVIKSQLRYNRLKKETSLLKLDFQDQIINTHVHTQNSIVNDVHDSFGSNLALLKMSLLNLKKTSNEVIPLELNKIESLLDNFNNDYRYLLNSKFSPTIAPESLAIQINNLVDKLDELSNATITAQIKFSETNLNKVNCLSIYRIISELLTNSIKHSKAENISLSLYQISDTMSIETRDDGIGFNTRKQHQGSFGMNSLRERIKLLSGDINIHSEINKGTTIKISLPYGG